jgi:hypothetical protein
MPHCISQLAEDTTVELLQNQVTGFVVTTEALGKERQIVLPKLDLSNSKSSQLFRAWMDPESYIENDQLLFPALFVYTVATLDQHKQPGYDFSGSIDVRLDILISSDDLDIPEDLQQIANVYTDALYTVFGINAITNVVQGTNLLFYGGVRVARSRAVQGARSWYQHLSVSLPFFTNE